MISAIYSSCSAVCCFEKKQESIADNIANVNTDGFKKTRVTFQSYTVGAVSPTVSRIDSSGQMAFDQATESSSPIAKSNVEFAEEFPHAMVNERSHEANIKVIRTADEMIGSLLDIKS